MISRERLIEEVACLMVEVRELREENLELNEKIKEYEINIPDEKYLSIKLADMSLSVRSINALERANVVTVRDIVTKTQQELLKTRLLGRRAINEIRLFLSSMNLEFGMVL